MVPWNDAFRRLAVWLLLVLSSALAEGGPEGDLGHNSIVEACLRDEHCARRLSGALAANNDTNSSNSTAEPPLFDLSKPAWNVTELVAPGAPVQINGDIILGAFFAIRGQWAYDPSVSNDPFPSWQYALMMKVALIAFANGLVFDQPAVKSEHSMQFIIVDQCNEPVDRHLGEKCQVPYNMQMLHDFFLDGPGFPRARASVGGSIYTQKLAHLGAFHGSPIVGFAQSEDSLSDKASYPTYLRTNQPLKFMFRVIGTVVSQMGYTIMDQFFCLSDQAQLIIAVSTDFYNSLGLRTAAFLINKYRYTASPAGSLADQKYLELLGDPDESAAKKAHYDAVLESALAFNAHVHQNTVHSDCAFFDVLHEFEMRGLIGRGHFWLGWNPAYGPYESSYQIAMTVMIPSLTGYSSDYIYGKPFDGGLWMNIYGDSESPRTKAFTDLLAYVGDHQEELLEPWLVNKFPPEVFKDPANGIWQIYLGVDFIDAVMATVYAANACLVKYGLSFTDAQMLEELKNSDFEGVGKRIRFNENLDPISEMRFENYRYPVGWTVNTPGDPLGDVVQVGSYTTEVVWTDSLVFYGGYTEQPPDKDLLCPLGTMYERVSAQCLDCPPGKYTARLGMAFCQDCSPGTYSATNKTAACKPCMEGTFADLPGSIACQTCSAGTYNDGVQQSECKECAAGSYSSTAAKLCTLCDRGSFTTGKGFQSCELCPAALTTVDVGTVDADLCVCPEGTYRDGQTRSCSSCPEGMDCPIGSDELHLGLWISGARRLRTCTTKEECPIPVALPGYMTREDEPLRPFKCLNAGSCPGGPPGTCGSHLDTSSVGCANCEANARRDGDGCTPCDGGVDAAPFALAPIVVFVLLAVFVWYVNRDKMMESKVSLSFGLIGTITISTLQTMSMFSTLNIDWFEPMRGVIQGLGFMQFDPEFLKPSCAVATSSTLIFLGRQLIPLFLCIVTLLIVLVERYCLRFKIDANVCFINSVGMIFFGLFISMISNSFTPFVCFQHPDGSWSLLSDPSILCWHDKERTFMVTVAVILFIAVPVPYLAIVAWATANHGRFVYEGASGNNRFLLAFRFLFHRFQPQAYFYSSIGMFRALMICLTPVVIAKDPVFQLCILAFIIIMVGLVSNRLQPWKAASANFAEASMNALLVLFIVCGAANADLRPHEASIQSFTSFLLFLGSAIIVFVLVRSAIHFVRPPLKFDVAVCCSIADAGAQARLLKVVMARRNYKVCLSSDLGNDADIVFDFLKKSTRGLAVFLTRTCLTKPLVAGQIAISYKGKLKMAAYRAPSFVPPLPEDLANLPGYLEISSLSLGQSGIDWAAVKVAYMDLLASPDTLNLADMARDWLPRFTDIASRFCPMQSFLDSTPTPKQGMVLISCDPTDDNAIATAGIITCKLNLLLPREVNFDNTMTLLEDDGNTRELVNMARAIVVVLSPSSLQRKLQLRIIHLAMTRLIKGDANPHRQRSQFRKEARKSTKQIDIKGGFQWPSMCWRKSGAERRGSRRFSTSLRTEVDFEVIPVVMDGFQFPTVESFDVLFPGLAGGKLDDIKGFFDHMPCRLSVEGSDRLLQREIEAIACLLPTLHDTQTASFQVNEDEEVMLQGNNTTVEQPTKTVYL